MKIFKKKKDERPEFNPNIKIGTAGNAVLFDDNNELLKACFKVLGLKPNEYLYYDDIDSMNVVEDDMTTTKSGAGGAIGGALLFGPTGAIIGGLAKRGKEKGKFTEKLHINIILKDGTVKTLHMIDAKTKKDTYSYKQIYKDFLSIGSKLESIINSNNNTQEQLSTKDKLFELKELLDAGIITQDEFNNEKTKILSRS